jgi:hypothetical protein
LARYRELGQRVPIGRVYWLIQPPTR